MFHLPKDGQTLEDQVEYADGWVVGRGEEARVRGYHLLLCFAVVEHLIAHRLWRRQTRRRLICVLIGMTATCEDAGKAAKERQLLLRLIVTITTLGRRCLGCVALRGSWGTIYRHLIIFVFKIHCEVQSLEVRHCLFILRWCKLWIQVLIINSNYNKEIWKINVLSID